MTVTEGAPAPRERDTVPRGAVPNNLLYAGVTVGLILIFAGIGLLTAGRDSLLSSLMTCVGFGIVLAAFGSITTGSWAGWTVTGSGAMAIVLFLLLEQYQPAPTPLLYKKGQLRGDLSKIADLRIIDELPMYEYRDRTTSSIRFVLLDKRLKSSRLSIQVDTTEKGPGREFFELIGDGQAIERRYLSEGTENDRQIQWAFDYDRRVVTDGADIIFSEQDSLQERLIPSSRSGILERLPGITIQVTKAFADGAQTNQQVAAVENLVRELKSEETSVRRNARDALAALGPSAVDGMMAAVRSNPSDYRVRLGVLYALAEMLRRNPDERSLISSALRDDDFSLLVSAASDDDKTIRLQAADFLYLLKDPRAVRPSIEAARSTRDPNKATNQVLIIRQSGQSLSASEKQSVINDLRAGPGPNNDLVGSQGWLKKTLGDW